MRAIAMAAALSLVLGGAAFAQSKCDSGMTKAAGKKVACKAGVVAKGQAKNLPPDPAKTAKCEAKFAKACAKAQGRGDCNVHQGSCAALEAVADDCAADLDSSESPSGAFLE